MEGSGGRMERRGGRVGEWEGGSHSEPVVASKKRLETLPLSTIWLGIGMTLTARFVRETLEEMRGEEGRRRKGCELTKRIQLQTAHLLGRVGQCRKGCRRG